MARKLLRGMIRRLNGTYIAVWWVFNNSEEDLLGVDFTTNGEQVKEVLENGRKNIT